MGETVLAIRLRALGDVVLTTPALRALKRGHPDAALEVVTEARYAPLLEGLAAVDRVWTLERTHSATPRLVAELRRRSIRVAVDFFGNPRSALLTRLCGARRRFGYALRGRGSWYHVQVPRSVDPAPGRREYAAATHVRLAIAAGGVEDGLEPRIALTAAAMREAAALVAAAGFAATDSVVGLVAAGTWPTKRWPVAYAALLAERLRREGRPVLLLAGPGEDAVTRAVCERLPDLPVLPPCGVGTLAAVVARLGAVIGNDSGPMHIAAAFGVPTFAWFGPTHPDTWTAPAPRHAVWRSSVPCRACDRTVCAHWNCLPELAPERAAELVGEHLRRHG
jgi:ADP-heptose:LPS heptosyltransferase